MDDRVGFDEIALRLVLAVLFGGVIGFNREQADRPAGLRTISLVSLGSATFVLIGIQIVLQGRWSDQSSPDPTRVLAGLVGGVGFLGAGAILRTGSRVKGVTTAASIWAAAALGAACGLGQFVVAGLATALTFMILWLDDFERAFLGPKHPRGSGGEGRHEDSEEAARRGQTFQP